MEETKTLAITDDLTKLYNHRYLIHQLTKELKRAKRYKEPLSFIMMDIDHFKQYNDNNGHEKGNELLAELAKLLKAETREADVIARYGGEEFAIICPKTDKKSALDIAERLRSKIEMFDFPCACYQPCGRITVSFGVASHPEDAAEISELIDRADAGLYLAKRKGRNQVCAA